MNDEQERGPFGDARPDADFGQSGARPSERQEDVSDRDNVGTVSPEDYPSEERSGFSQQQQQQSEYGESGQNFGEDELDELDDEDFDEDDEDDDDVQADYSGEAFGSGAGAGGSGNAEDYDDDPVGGGGSGIQQPMRDAPDSYGDGSSGGMR
jgi:hypothetical protein